MLVTCFFYGSRLEKGSVCLRQNADDELFGLAKEHGLNGIILGLIAQPAVERNKPFIYTHALRYIHQLCNVHLSVNTESKFISYA